MTISMKYFNRTILTNKMHKQGLLWSFDILKDYFGYSLQFQEPKWLLPPRKKPQISLTINKNKTPSIPYAYRVCIHGTSSLYKYPINSNCFLKKQLIAIVMKKEHQNKSLMTNTIKINNS